MPHLETGRAGVCIESLDNFKQFMKAGLEMWEFLATGTVGVGGWESVGASHQSESGAAVPAFKSTHKLSGSTAPISCCS